MADPVRTSQTGQAQRGLLVKTGCSWGLFGREGAWEGAWGLERELVRTRMQCGAMHGDTPWRWKHGVLMHIFQFPTIAMKPTAIPIHPPGRSGLPAACGHIQMIQWLIR